jgi:hypothetical protein
LNEESASKCSEPDPEQLSTSVVAYVPPVHELAEALNPGFTSKFQGLCVRHLQAPFPSQNLLLPQDVVCEASSPSPQLPFD